MVKEPKHRHRAIVIAFAVGFLLGAVSYRELRPLLVDLRKQIALQLEYLPPSGRLDCARAASSPIARVEALTAVIGARLYVFGGFERGLRASTRSDLYNPETDTWDRIADLPMPVTHAGVAIDGPHVWVAGGFIGDHPGRATDLVWRYDSLTNRWDAMPSLPEPRASAPLVRHGRYLHYFGGLLSDRETDSGDHWRLNIDSPSSWEPRAQMPAPRNHGAGIELDGLIYMIGGQHGHDRTFEDVASVHAYNPATNAWQELSPLPSGRSHFEPGTFTTRGKIVIFGGRSNTRRVLYDVTAYDPMTDAWTALVPMSVPARAPTAALVGHRVLIGMGGVLPSGTAPRAEISACTLEEIGLVGGR